MPHTCLEYKEGRKYLEKDKNAIKDCHHSLADSLAVLITHPLIVQLTHNFTYLCIRLRAIASTHWCTHQSTRSSISTYIVTESFHVLVIAATTLHTRTHTTASATTSASHSQRHSMQITHHVLIQSCSIHHYFYIFTTTDPLATHKAIRVSPPEQLEVETLASMVVLPKMSIRGVRGPISRRTRSLYRWLAGFGGNTGCVLLEVCMHGEWYGAFCVVTVLMLLWIYL